MADLVGGPELEQRLQAVAKVPPQIMSQLALAVVREAKTLVPRRTGNLGRSIAIVSQTEGKVIIEASAGYAAFVEFGTRGGQIITPRAARALAWAPGVAGGASRRLSGRPRKGAALVFAMRVIRGATPAQPFLAPAAEAAIEGAGLADQVVAAWNEG